MQFALPQGLCLKPLFLIFSLLLLLTLDSTKYSFLLVFLDLLELLGDF